MLSKDLTKYKKILYEATAIKPCDDFDFIVVSFVNYYLELQCALETLLNAENSVGMTYILRGQYEVFLQFAYLVEHLSNDFDLCTQRAQSYIYFHWLTNLQWYEHLKDDRNTKLMNDKLLSCPDIADEYKATKKRCRNPYWFSLYDGPVSFNKLEEHLNFKDEENPLYAVVSQVCHGKTVLRNTLNDTSEDVQNWICVSNSFISILAGQLLPFLIRHKVDIKELALFLISQIENEAEKERLQSQYESWCRNP